MTRQRLFSKYFLATTLIVILSLTVLTMVLTFAYNGYLAEIRQKSLEKASDSVEYMVGREDFSLKSDSEGFNYILYNISSISDADIFITDDSGVIKLCSCESAEAGDLCDHIGRQLSADILKKADNGTVSEIGRAGIYKELRYLRVEKAHIGSSSGYILTSAEASGISDLMLRLSKIYLLVAIIPIVIMFLAIYIMTYRLTRPLKLMSDAARAMARGDFSKRIPVTSDDEIGELAVSFNQMTNSLSQLEGMRKSFVANVSHELKTPMTTISGFIDGIIDGTIEPERQSYYLGIVSEEVKRLSRLVQSMLSLSKLESGEFTLKPAKFDFRELLISVVIGQERRIDGSEIIVSGLDALTSVTLNADRDLIYQVIYNLVDNAVKFTPKGGEIAFEIKVDSKKMIFSITNSGAGIPENELKNVFERFYKVDKSRSANKNGTGLGLYIVKTIVKTHGGSIKVSSRENEFTRFDVTLPIGGKKGYE